MKQPRINIKWYLLADIIVCLFTWLTFYYLRTVIYDYEFRIPGGFYIGLILYTLGWISLHFISGTYDNIYQKTTTGEISRTILVIMIGCFFLLFFFILKNPHTNNFNYYSEFFALLLPNFTCTLIIRLGFMGIIKRQIRSGKVYYNTLIAGSPEKALQFSKALESSGDESGLAIRGFYDNNGRKMPSGMTLRQFDNHKKLSEVIRDEKIEEVILAIEKNDREKITDILRELSDKEVNVKITADTVDIITGAVHTSNIRGVPLIDIHAGQLPSWQQNIKRLTDLLICAVIIILLWPLFIYIAIRVVASSKGPVIFRQERIGYKGRPFIMYKFRSMFTNAESNGPMLSSDKDERITGWGRKMRKWRMDELPQVWNVIKGEMSLVGPRPERKYYIDNILVTNPEYKYLFKVKPGITSWGMVKFGYASNVEEMIQRMQYDLLYVENISLALDLRILIYTIRTICSGQGK